MEGRERGIVCVVCIGVGRGVQGRNGVGVIVLLSDDWKLEL